MGVKEFISYKNPNKRVIARLATGKSIVEVLDGRTAEGDIKLGYVIALTDANGTAVTDDGIKVTASELRDLADTIYALIDSGAIKAQCTRGEYEKQMPPKEQPQKTLLW